MSTLRLSSLSTRVPEKMPIDIEGKNPAKPTYATSIAEPVLVKVIQRRIMYDNADPKREISLALQR